MNWRAALLTAAVCITLSWIGAWGIGQALTTQRVIDRHNVLSLTGQQPLEQEDDSITRAVIVLGIVGTAGSLLVAVIVGVALRPKAPPILK